MHYERQHTAQLIHQILGSNFLPVQTKSYQLSEDIDGGECLLAVTLKTGDERAKPLKFEGRGVGLVDALYDGLVARFAPEYPSLRTLSVVRFEVSGQIASGQQGGTDAEVAVTLCIKNSYGSKFEFATRGRSLVAATCKVVCEMAEYFINSERAYVMLFKALEDARGRNRQDLVDTFQAQMAQVVKSTSYSAVIDRLK